MPPGDLVHRRLEGLALGGANLASDNQTGDAGTVEFFATDSPERFARVGAVFLGRAIDPASVELVDLRAFR